MVHRNKKTESARSRRSSSTMGGSFRRNAVVISKSQRELAQRQQSVTQRQQDLKRQQARHKARIKMIATLAAIALVLLVHRMSGSSAELQTNASSRLNDEQVQLYSSEVMQSFNQSTIFGQTWLVDEAAFSSKLQKKYPEISQVIVTTKTPFSRVIEADIRFRKPVFIWRDATQTDQFVDSEGILFSKNLDPTSNSKKLIRIEDQSGVVLEEGSSVLTRQLISFVGQLHNKIPQLYPEGATISRVIIPRSTREVQIQVADQPYIIKFSSVRSIEEGVGELKVLLDYLKQTNTQPTAYIDLRVPNKAFYK